MPLEMQICIPVSSLISIGLNNLCQYHFWLHLTFGFILKWSKGTYCDQQPHSYWCVKCNTVIVSTKLKHFSLHVFASVIVIAPEALECTSLCLLSIGTAYGLPMCFQNELVDNHNKFNSVPRCSLG